MANWKDEARKAFEAKSQASRYKPAEGENFIRILPGVDDKGKPSHDVPPYAAYCACRDVGPNNRFMTSGKLPAGHPDGPGECWLVDEMLPKLKASPKKSVRAAAKAMEPIDMLIVQLMYKGPQGEWVGPVSWQPSFGGPRSLGVQILKLLHGAEVSHPTKGRVLALDRTGQGLQTRYTLVPEADATPIPKEILKKIKPLSDAYPAYDEDEMQDAYFGRETDDDEGPSESDAPAMAEDAGEKPAKKGKDKKSKSKKKKGKKS